MKYEIENNTLIVRIPLDTQNPPTSKSRKTLIVAGTGGFERTGITFKDGPLTGLELSVSVNATVPRKGPTRRSR